MPSLDWIQSALGLKGHCNFFSHLLIPLIFIKLTIFFFQSSKMEPTLQLMPTQLPMHNTAPHARRRNNRQSIHAMQSERMSLGEAAKLVS